MLSCIYKNDEIFVHNVNPPSVTNSSINLNNVVEPIIINQPTQFSFTVSPAGKELYEATVKVDGSSVAQLSSSTGVFGFTINPEIVGDGNKKLQISVEYLSLSPSLAGQLGQETITFSNEWSITIDTTPPSPIPAPQVYIDNGKSMISWTSPDKFTFTELIIYRTYLNSNNNIIARDSIKIPNHHLTTFHDASYVGGPVKYRIDLKGFKYYIVGAESFFNITPLSFSLDSSVPDPITTWSISPLYNNDIVILSGNETYPINEPGQIISNFIAFGQEPLLSFKIKANNPPPSYLPKYEYDFSTRIYRGIRLPAFKNMEYHVSKNVYLLLSTSKLYKLDANNFAVTDSIALPPTPNGNLVSSNNTEHIYLYNNDRLNEVNVDNLSLGQEINLKTITGSANQGFIYPPSLSDDNIITFQFVNKNFAVDLNMAQVVWQKNAIGRSSISPNSEYIYFNSSIYGNKDTNWSTLLGTISSSSINYCKFWQTDKIQIMAYRFFNNPTEIIDLSQGPDGMGVYNLSFTIPYNYQLDRHSQNFYKISPDGGGVFGDGYAYNSTTLEEVRKLSNIYIQNSGIFYINNHFFHSNGFVIP